MFNYDQLISRLSPEPPKGPPPLNLIGRIGEGIDEAVGKETELKAKIRAAAVEAAQKQADEANRQAFELRKLELESKLAGGREGRERSWKSGEAKLDRAADLERARVSAKGDKGPTIKDFADLWGEQQKGLSGVPKTVDEKVKELWGETTIKSTSGGYKGGLGEETSSKVGAGAFLSTEDTKLANQLKLLGRQVRLGNVAPEEAAYKIGEEFGENVDSLAYQIPPFVKEEEVVESYPSWFHKTARNFGASGIKKTIRGTKTTVKRGTVPEITRWGRLYDWGREFLDEQYNEGLLERQKASMMTGGSITTRADKIKEAWNAYKEEYESINGRPPDWREFVEDSRE